MKCLLFVPKNFYISPVLLIMITVPFNKNIFHIDLNIKFIFLKNEINIREVSQMLRYCCIREGSKRPV